MISLSVITYQQNAKLATNSINWRRTFGKAITKAYKKSKISAIITKQNVTNVNFEREGAGSNERETRKGE